MTINPERARIFRRLHHSGRPLVLPNAWDAASARLVERAGASAVATTSAAVSWSLGCADGQQLTRDQAVDVIARVAVAVTVPVSADIEAGYAGYAEDVATTVRAVLAAGAVGINLEDSSPKHPALRTVDDQCARIRAARAVDVDMFLNARIDTYLASAGALDETSTRATAYVAAGADGVFVPGVTHPATVAKLADAVDVPLNVMAGPGAPDVTELARLGVRRVSLGPALGQAAYGIVLRASQELLTTGTYETLGDAPMITDLDELMSSRP